MARVVRALVAPRPARERPTVRPSLRAGYRSSKTFRNLIAALLVIIAVVIVVIAAFPPGANRHRGRARRAGTGRRSRSRNAGGPCCRPPWARGGGVNQAMSRASVEPRRGPWSTSVGRVGLPRVAKGFDADEAWVGVRCSGDRHPQHETTEIDGIHLERVRPANPSGTGNIDYAQAAPAAPRLRAVYGDAAPETAALAAASVTDQIEQLREVPLSERMTPRQAVGSRWWRGTSVSSRVPPPPPPARRGSVAPSSPAPSTRPRHCSVCSDSRLAAEIIFERGARRPVRGTQRRPGHSPTRFIGSLEYAVGRARGPAHRGARARRLRRCRRGHRQHRPRRPDPAGLHLAPDRPHRAGRASRAAGERGRRAPSRARRPRAGRTGASAPHRGELLRASELISEAVAEGPHPPSWGPTTDSTREKRSTSSSWATWSTKRVENARS